MSRSSPTDENRTRCRLGRKRFKKSENVSRSTDQPSDAIRSIDDVGEGHYCRIWSTTFSNSSFSPIVRAQRDENIGSRLVLACILLLQFARAEVNERRFPARCYSFDGVVFLRFVYEVIRDVPYPSNLLKRQPRILTSPL